MPELSDLDKKTIAVRLDEWFEWHWDEWFVPEEIFRFYDWRDPATKKVVYNRLAYLTKAKQPPKLKKSGRLYRIIDREAIILNWKNANGSSFFDIKLPFDLHKFVRLHRRSLMVIGGVSNTGKTTFAHNIISLNWASHNIVLLDSENSEEELKARFSHYPDYMEWPSDLVRDRSSNFSDVIEPDAINIIDYLEVQDNFWLVGRYLREIRDALKNGIAIVILQKGEASKLPVGKEFSRHLARVVITIDNGVLTIVKAKDRAQKGINPVNAKWSFYIDETGTQFLDVKRIP